MTSSENTLSDKPIQSSHKVKRVYLHIGLPKTGTTSIQNFFSINEEFFAKSGVLVPKSGRHSIFVDSAHHLLALAFMLDRWDELQLKIDLEDISSAWPSLIREIESSDCNEVFISSEWFAFDVHSGLNIKQIRDYLLNYEVIIVIVLRNVVDFVNSVYSQRVRDGFGGTVAEYVGLAGNNLNWSALVARWESVFGADHLIVLDFEEVKRGVLIDNFIISVFGRPVLEGLFEKNTLKNESISAAATEFLREINNSELSASKKEWTRDYVKSLFSEMSGSLTQAKFLSRDAEEIIQNRCVWPPLRRRPIFLKA